MSLIDNLNAINGCKEDIKDALIRKGVDMSDVAFSGYAAKIDGLQLGSGVVPAPVGDYIYSNGYVDGGDNEIVNLIPHKIELDSENKFRIELVCPIEIPVYTYSNYDIIFTVDVPDTYRITEGGFEIYDGLKKEYKACPYKENPRHTTVVRDGVTYNSFVRLVADGEDMGSEDIATDILNYRITIEKV